MLCKNPPLNFLIVSQKKIIEVGSWQLAVGSWQWAVGRRWEAVGNGIEDLWNLDVT